MSYRLRTFRMNQDLVHLDMSDESNFTRQQNKLKFLLTALKIFNVIDSNLEPIGDATLEVLIKRKNRQDDELICWDHILSVLSDRLYDLYINTTSVKEIWDVLKNKYKAKEKGTNKFLIYLNTLISKFYIIFLYSLKYMNHKSLSTN